MSQKYSVTVVNNSSNDGSVCVYQIDPQMANLQVQSLAWLSMRTHPTTKVQFNWTQDYNFVWDETGTLKPGIVFEASQVWDANLTTSNQVTFSYQDGAFTFANLTQASTTGSLVIRQDNTIPAGFAAVGIGMAGAPTFVVQAQPNMTAIFAPHPQYWVTFGNYQKGQVLDTSMITNAAQIAFPPNVYRMVATLNPDNTWTVTPSLTLAETAAAELPTEE